MNQLQQLHRDAMAAAESGSVAKRDNDSVAAMRYFREALELETQAAHCAPAGYEPTRSVRSRPFCDETVENKAILKGRCAGKCRDAFKKLLVFRDFHPECLSQNGRLRCNP